MRNEVAIHDDRVHIMLFIEPLSDLVDERQRRIDSIETILQIAGANELAQRIVLRNHLVDIVAHLVRELGALIERLEGKCHCLLNRRSAGHVRNFLGESRPAVFDLAGALLGIVQVLVVNFEGTFDELIHSLPAVVIEFLYLRHDEQLGLVVSAFGQDLGTVVGLVMEVVEERKLQLVTALVESQLLSVNNVVFEKVQHSHVFCTINLVYHFKVHEFLHALLNAVQ